MAKRPDLGKKRDKERPTRRILTGREKEVAQWIKEGKSIPGIFEDLRKGHADIPDNARVGLARVILADPDLSAALKTRIEAIVKRNEGARRNTVAADVGREIGLGGRQALRFANEQGINLEPVDVVAHIRKRSVEGASQQTIADELGIGPATVNKLIQKHSIQKVGRYAKQDRSTLKTDLLETMLTTPVPEGSHVVPHQTLIEKHPESGNTDVARDRKINKTKNALAGEITGLLGKIRGERGARRRDLWGELMGLRDEEPSKSVKDRRRELLEELEYGTDAARDRRGDIQGLKRAIDHEYFGGRDVCPIEFARRAVRLHMVQEGHRMFDEQIPTPPNLNEARDACLRYSKAVRGRRNARPVNRMSTTELSNGAPHLWSLVKKKLEQRRGSVTAQEVARVVKWILSEEPPHDVKADWSKKGVRVDAATRRIEERGGDISAINLKWLDKNKGLLQYYLGKGAENPREAIKMLLEELGRKPTEEEARIIDTRRNRPAQLKLVLQHYHPGRLRRHYEGFLGLNKPATGRVMVALRDDLTRAIDEGESAASIADRYGVGARGIANVIDRFKDGQNRDQQGKIRMFMGPPGMANTPIERREDMYSIDELREDLTAHRRFLQGGPGRHVPANVQRSNEARQLEGDILRLTEACENRDYDAMDRHASALIGSARAALGPESGHRLIIAMDRKGGSRTFELTGNRVNRIIKTAENIKEEARHRQRKR